jgi:hypothetical protein
MVISAARPRAGEYRDLFWIPACTGMSGVYVLFIEEAGQW